MSWLARAALGLLIVCLDGLWPETVLSHEFHVSSAEMEFNSQSGQFEVAMKLSALDCEHAISQLSQQGTVAKLPVHSDQRGELIETERAILNSEITGQHQRLFKKYLEGTFFLSRRSEQLNASAEYHSELTWIGSEVEGTTIWLYFELKPPKGPGELFLTNKVFADLNKGQTNTVVLISQAERVSFKTDSSNFQVSLTPYK